MKIRWPAYPAINDALLETLSKYGDAGFLELSEADREAAAKFNVQETLERALKDRSKKEA